MEIFPPWESVVGENNGQYKFRRQVSVLCEAPFDRDLDDCQIEWHKHHHARQEPHMLIETLAERLKAVRLGMILL